LGSTVFGCRTSPEAKEAKFLNRGRALLAKKDYQRALLEFRNASTAVPNDAEPYYQMGLVYLENRDFTNAARAIQRAIAINPKHLGAQLKLSELMANTRDEKLIAEAGSRIQSVFGQSPTDPEVLETLAIAEWKLGKPEEAMERLEQALRRFPAHLQSSMTLARMKLSKNDWNGAEEILKRAVTDAPKSAAAALALGEFYAFVRKLDKAEPSLERSVELDKTNGPALVALAGVQAAAKKTAAAELTYRRVSALLEKAYRPFHAIFLYQSGRQEEAVAELSGLVKSDPKDRGARTALVMIYVGTKQLSKAEDVLAAALKVNPKDTDALLQRAGLRLRSGRADDAEKDLHQVLHFDPNSARAHLALAGVNKSKGLVEVQRQELEGVLKSDPASLEARIELAVSFLDAKEAKTSLGVLSEAPDYQKQDIRWILARNWALLSMGRLSEAKTGVELALQVNRTPAAVFQGAALRVFERDFAGALASLEEVLARDDTDANALNLMMQVYEAQHEVLRGTDRLKELAATHPGSALHQTVLGRWYRRRNNVTDARKAFEAAKLADPHYVPADLSLAEMDIREGHGDAARKRLDGLVKTNPANVSVLLLSARADEQWGDTQAAIARYRGVINLDRTNPIALNNLAYLLVPSDPDEALKYAQQAVELAPGEASFQDTLGWIYYRKGLSTMAVQHLKAAVDKESTPRRQFHLGMSYLKIGDQANGQKLVREALAKDPSLAKTEQGW
jgi:tetratricopeptide (TPR) repeat protein